MTPPRPFNVRSMDRRRALQVTVGALSLAALGGCTRALSQYAGLGANVTVKSDLTYGPEERHKLDLYLPDAATDETPLLLFLYGGSWRWGSKERYGFVGYPVAERGFAVAVADYRLYPDVRFPDFNHDGAMAAAWLQKHRKEFGLAPGPLHLMGHSAGAHIAASIALDHSYLADAGLNPKDLGRLVGLSGPYGFFPSQVGYIRDIFPPPDKENLARPLTFARADAPEMLLLHGGDDGLVEPRNALELAKAQREAGAEAASKIYPGIGHREIIAAVTPPFQGLAPVLDDAVAFLKGASAASVASGSAGSSEA